jgi:hypothetical protein
MDTDGTPPLRHDGGHSMLFRRLDDNQLIMSMHVADRGPKMLTMFEMEEKGGDLHIINEITGNWYHTVGGNALPFKKDVPCTDEPAFTKLGPTGYEAALAEKVSAKKPSRITGKKAPAAPANEEQKKKAETQSE